MRVTVVEDKGTLLLVQFEEHTGWLPREKLRMPSEVAGSRDVAPALPTARLPRPETSSSQELDDLERFTALRELKDQLERLERRARRSAPRLPQRVPSPSLTNTQRPHPALSLLRCQRPVWESHLGASPTRAFTVGSMNRTSYSVSTRAFLRLEPSSYSGRAGPGPISSMRGGTRPSAGAGQAHRAANRRRG